MADDKIKIYGELESGVPDGKVTDIRQVNMGTLHIDPEGFEGEYGYKYPMIKSEPTRGPLGGGSMSAFVINPDFIGFESSNGHKFGLYYKNTEGGSFSVVSADGVFTKENVDQNNEKDIANVKFVNDRIKNSLTVTTYPYPSTRNILVEPERFVGIWNNITIPARSEVYARITMNLNESSVEGHLVCFGFLADAQTVASTAAPLPAVATVEHTMCLSHWFEEATTLSVMVHSTTTAYVTDVVNPKGAAMSGGTELIIKTHA